MHRHDDVQISSASSGPHAPDPIAEQLLLLPLILASLTEVRQILTGKMKSHLTVEEAAEELGRSDYTIRTWIREGRLPAVRVTGTGPRGRLLIARDDIRQLVSTGKA
jgi:excisionase family DNA binding protein